MSRRPSITFEGLIAIVVILIFCLAASFSAYRIIKWNKDFHHSAQGLHNSFLLFDRAFSDFEVSFLNYMTDPVNGDKYLLHLPGHLSYTQKIHDSFMKMSRAHLRHEKNRYAHTVTRLSDDMTVLVYLVEKMMDSPTGENEKKVLKKIHEVKKSLPAVHSMLATNLVFDEQITERRMHHLWLFLSVIVMGLSGLALIALLLEKIKNLEALGEENQKVMRLLEPRMAAIEEARDGIGITDGQGIIRYVNGSLARYHGYTEAHELIGRPWQDLFTKEQQAWFDVEVFPFLRTDGHWQGQCKGIRKGQKEEIPFDLAMTRMTDGGWVWVVRDYTELMEAISVSNKRLAAIEAAGDGIGIVDAHGNLTYLNRALMDLHNINPDDMYDYIGQPWVKLYNEKGRKDIVEKVLPLLNESGSWRGETVLRRNGEIIYTEMSLTKLPDGGMIGTARNVTDRREAEKENEILQKQIFHSQKMEAIGRLAGGIAHDFNNILASMLGYTEFLIEDLPPETKQHKFAQQIMQGGLQARKLIEQILAFSRRKEITRTLINIGDVVEDTTAMLRATMPATINIEMEVLTRNTKVSANATQMSQVVMNLCVNARDAMMDQKGVLRIVIDAVKGQAADFPSDFPDALPPPNYSPEVRVLGRENGSTVLYLGHVARDLDYIAISVEDNGVGMTREIMENVFEPFFTTKDLDKGTGLGLSTVMGIVAAHQGAMVVRSRPGTGTVFTLYLGAAQDVPADNMPEQAVEAAARGRGRILLVEDQEDVRSMLVHMLDRLGYSARACGSAEEAVDILREQAGQYDLVLSDHMMPRMSGLEMAALIEKDFPKLPVILITGYSKEALEKTIRDSGNIRTILKKPVDSKVLAQAIALILTKS